MHLSVALESRYDRTPDGAVWAPGWFLYSFWTRYLDVFDQVRVISRVRDVASVPEDWERVDGEGVSVVGLPHYLGPLEYLRRAKRLRDAVGCAVTTDDAVIIRAPGIVPSLAFRHMRRVGKPYAVEIVSDPYEVFAPGSVKHPLRPLFRSLFSRELKAQCSQACGAAYVTERTLQQRYPPPFRGKSTHYSSVELSPSAFVAAPRSLRHATRPTLISVGSLTQLYKAPDVLIEAVALCTQWGLELNLQFVGGGQYRAVLAVRAERLGLGARVHFLGHLSSRDAVRAHLDMADLFVLPSRTEGLPRAMLEAMARALPCIGSTAGGIPELLPAEDMVPPGDALSLALKIRSVLTDPVRLMSMSSRNLEKAKGYHEGILRERRNAFYNSVLDVTREWLLDVDRSS